MVNPKKPASSGKSADWRGSLSHGQRDATHKHAKWDRRQMRKLGTTPPNPWFDKEHSATGRGSELMGHSPPFVAWAGQKTARVKAGANSGKTTRGNRMGQFSPGQREATLEHMRLDAGQMEELGPNPHPVSSRVVEESVSASGRGMVIETRWSDGHTSIGNPQRAHLRGVSMKPPERKKTGK